MSDRKPVQLQPNVKELLDLFQTKHELKSSSAAVEKLLNGFQKPKGKAEEEIEEAPKRVKQAEGKKSAR